MDSFWDNLKYDWDLGLYKVGLKAIPPIVVPSGDTPNDIAIRNEASQLESQYTYWNMAKTAVKETIPQLEMTAVIATVIIIAAVIFFWKEIKNHG